MEENYKRWVFVFEVITPSSDFQVERVFTTENENQALQESKLMCSELNSSNITFTLIEIRNESNEIVWIKGQF